MENLYNIHDTKYGRYKTRTSNDDETMKEANQLL